MLKIQALRSFARRNEKETGAEMVEVVTSAQMRAIERAAIESGQVTGAELMERAGATVVAEAVAVVAPPSAPQAVVLCGPGNNGGDGYVVARLLAQRGWTVKAYAWGDPARMPADALAMRRAAEGVVKITPLGAGVVPRWFWDYDPPPAPDVVVDALFGIGLGRYPVPLFRLLQRYCPPTRAWKVIAVDMPSVLSAETGAVFDPGPGIAGAHDFGADVTVTFHAPKPGHLLGDGPRLRGRLVVADIGLGPWDHHRHDA